MANFGVLSGTKIARSAMRTARFVKQRVFERAKPVAEQISAQAAAVVKSVQRFFDSTPGQTGKYQKVSYDNLNKQDPTAQIKLKQRAIAEVQAQSREQLAEALDAYSRGRIGIESFGTLARGIIRRQALAGAIIGVGGIANLTENILTATNRLINEQFNLLDGFIDDLATKPRDSTAKDRIRAAQYANSTFSAAANASRQAQLDAGGANNLEERRRLGGAEHCADCLELEGEGWQDAGTLPAIGQGTVCGSNCHCWIQVRTKQDNDLNTNDVSV